MGITSQRAAERRKSVAPGERSAASVTRGSRPEKNRAREAGGRCSSVRYSSSYLCKPCGFERKVVELEPRNVFGQHALGAFYVRTGNKTGAMQQNYILKDLDPKLAADLLKLIPK
jgi:hypothetical protein